MNTEHSLEPCDVEQHFEVANTRNKVTLQSDSSVMSNFITELHCNIALLQAERTPYSTNEMKQLLTKTNLLWCSTVHVLIGVNPWVLQFSLHLN